MGLDARQLLEYVVRPALRAFGPGYSTISAEQLVLGTAAQESGLRYLRQVGGGPALGLWQMEPATFRWLRDQFAPQKGLSAAANKFTDGQPEDAGLLWNLRLGAAYCRLRYVPDPRPLPPAGDTLGQASYWKRVYNTTAGAGQVDQYLQAWERLVAPARLWP